MALSFRQWIVREYQDDSVLAWSRTPEEALTEDMDFYERYLRADGTQSQLDGFRLLRAHVGENTFSFNPPANAQRPSFRTWFDTENQQRRSEGESEMTLREGLRDYPAEVDLSPEEENDFTLARDRHFEENRHQMYGFARGSYSRVVEGLRTARNTSLQLGLDSLHYWPNEECGSQDRNPIIQSLVHVNQALQRFIAMEEPPPDEVWHDIMSEIRRAESLVADADRRARDEVVDEVARTVMRRALETVNEDTSSVTSSPVIPRVRITTPSRNAPGDDSPLINRNKGKRLHELKSPPKPEVALGTTVTCRSCRREAIRFYPGGKCGEVKPFPAWHRMRGHTRRVRRCPDCIRIREFSFPDELEQRNAQFRRVYRRMKTFNRYCRGEHPNPHPDEEWTRYRDHLVIIDDERSFGQNERRMNEQSQHMLGRHSLDLRQLRTQSPFVQEAAAVHNSTQIAYWREYTAGRRLHAFNSLAAVEEPRDFRAEADLHSEDAVLARIVEDMEQCTSRQERIEATDEVYDTDLLYMSGIIRDSFDTHVGQYCSSECQEEVLNADEDEPLPDYEDYDGAADYYREHEEPEVSFYEWTIRSYEEDETHNVGIPTENALDEDLNHYEWYFRNFGTELQLNDFRIRRAEIGNSYYDFNSEKFNHVPFQQWLLDYNLRQEIRGQAQVTSTIEALELYWEDVLKDEYDEMQEEFHRSRTRWFEECRREFYGHARDGYSPLIERLRNLRAECERITDWTNEHYCHLASVRENIGCICSILTTRIAMEREPTDEQWQRILEMGREAVRQMRETMRQEPATREVNWNQLFAQLSEAWEVQDHSAVGDVDESEAEDERTTRLRSRFLQQAPVAEFDDYSEG